MVAKTTKSWPVESCNSRAILRRSSSCKRKSCGEALQMFFRLLSLRKFMSSANDSITTALGINNWIGAQPNPGDRAVRPHNSAFERVKGFSTNQPLHSFLNLSMIIRMHAFQPRARVCVQALSCATPDRLVGTIDEQNLA